MFSLYQEAANIIDQAFAYAAHTQPEWPGQRGKERWEIFKNYLDEIAKELLCKYQFEESIDLYWLNYCAVKEACDNLVLSELESCDYMVLGGLDISGEDSIESILGDEYIQYQRLRNELIKKYDVHCDVRVSWKLACSMGEESNMSRINLCKEAESIIEDALAYGATKTEWPGQRGKERWERLESEVDDAMISLTNEGRYYDPYDGMCEYEAVTLGCDYLVLDELDPSGEKDIESLFGDKIDVYKRFRDKLIDKYDVYCDIELYMEDNS